jgi:hypothetical protein
MSDGRRYLAVKLCVGIAAITGWAGFTAVSVSSSAGHAPVAALSADQSNAFWSHWGDGRAELSGYRLMQPRYGAARPGTAVLIFVTEDFSDSLRVKADPGQHPASDVYPVLKLNAVRDFQTGIYDYNVMTSVFARVAAGWPVAKVSFSSQEWCGQVWHQLLPRGGSVAGISHSYFDGEADGTEKLAEPADGVIEDVLPILVRGWGSAFLAPGTSRTVSLLPSLLRARLEHRPLAWGRATVSAAAAATSAAVPAGTFQVRRWTVARADGGPVTTYDVELASPHRLVAWATSDGEKAELLGSERLAYWKMNGPGGEQALEKLGLRVPATAWSIAPDAAHGRNTFEP